MTTLWLTSNENNDQSTLLITMLSMLFTLISICLSGLEYITALKFMNAGSVMSIQYQIKSKEIAAMSSGKFKQSLVLRRNPTVHVMAKALKISRKQVERLKPLQNGDGAMFTFFVAIGANKSGSGFVKMKQRIETAVTDKSLQKVCMILYPSKQEQACW